MDTVTVVHFVLARVELMVVKAFRGSRCVMVGCFVPCLAGAAKWVQAKGCEGRWGRGHVRRKGAKVDLGVRGMNDNSAVVGA
jgi:hypothetical protein